MVNPRSATHLIPHTEQATDCQHRPIPGTFDPAAVPSTTGQRRVLFVTAGGWERASTRCGVLQYLPRLDAAWEVTHCALGPSPWAERRHRLVEHSSRTLWQRAARRLRYHWYRAHERRVDSARMGASTRGRHDLVF